jgi:hypothetical protein
MLEQRRAKVIKAAALLFGVLGVSLIYLLFFNTGLEIVSDPDNPSTHVAIFNSSQHRIREVSVAFLVQEQKIVVETIPLLDPSQTVSIPLPPEYAYNGSFTLQASAPYHLTRQISIAAQSAKVDNANVSFTFSFPTLGFVGQSSSVLIEGCSYENFPLDFKAELTDFSQGELVAPSEDWVIPPSSCSEVVLEFIPVAATDDLSFKIRVFTPTRVLAEKDAMITIQSLDENGGIENA